MELKEAIDTIKEAELFGAGDKHGKQVHLLEALAVVVSDNCRRIDELDAGATAGSLPPVDYEAKWRELLSLLPKCDECERIATAECVKREWADYACKDHMDDPEYEELPWAAHVREFEALEPST